MHALPLRLHEPPMEPASTRGTGSRVSTVYLRHFPKGPNCEVCLMTKITRASCRRRADAVMPRAENSCDLIAADHKVQSEESESRNNHRYAVVAQDLATEWSKSNPCKTKTRFLEPTRNRKVFYTDNSLDFGKPYEDLSWNHCASTPHRSGNKWDC